MMTARIKVQPVRAANGRILGWAINQGGQELGFYGVYLRDWDGNPHTQAMIRAQHIARGEK